MVGVGWGLDVGVGGGSATVSQNLVLAMELAKSVDAKLISIAVNAGVLLFDS